MKKVVGVKLGFVNGLLVQKLVRAKINLCKEKSVGNQKCKTDIQQKRPNPSKQIVDLLIAPPL